MEPNLLLIGRIRGNISDMRIFPFFLLSVSCGLNISSYEDDLKLIESMTEKAKNPYKNLSSKELAEKALRRGFLRAIAKGYSLFDLTDLGRLSERCLVADDGKKVVLHINQYLSQKDQAKAYIVGKLHSHNESKKIDEKFVIVVRKIDEWVNLYMRKEGGADRYIMNKMYIFLLLMANIVRLFSKKSKFWNEIAQNYERQWTITCTLFKQIADDYPQNPLDTFLMLVYFLNAAEGIYREETYV